MHHLFFFLSISILKRKHQILSIDIVCEYTLNQICYLLVEYIVSIRKQYNSVFMKQPRLLLSLLFCLWLTPEIQAQGTRLLRQPTISSQYIVFAYGGDLWRTDLDGKNLIRLTSTPAVESDPHFSPDGSSIAFTSNRSGGTAARGLPRKTARRSPIRCQKLRGFGSSGQGPWHSSGVAQQSMNQV